MLAFFNTLFNTQSSVTSGGRAFTVHMATEDNNQHWSQLMKLAQSGDEGAYAQLLNEIAPVIERSLQKQFGRFALIEDCVQEVLLAIHQARHTYSPHRPFKPWMNALAKHKTIDFFRSQNRHKHTVSNDLETIDEIAETTEFNVDDYLSGAKLLASLEKPNRDALVYTKLMGFSIEDTAIKLETTPAAVKQRVKRAIAKTSRLLALSLD